MTETSSRVHQLGSSPSQPQAEGNSDVEDSENEDDWFDGSKMYFLGFLLFSSLILVGLISRTGLVCSGLRVQTRPPALKLNDETKQALRAQVDLCVHDFLI